MSFLNFCRGCGTFVSLMLEKQELTIARMQINQNLAQTVIHNIYDTLQLLNKNSPFRETIRIATRQKLQKDVLLKAEYPDLVSIGEDELIPQWELITTHYSKSDSCLSVSIKTISNDTYLLEVTDTIKIFSFDNEGFLYEIDSYIDNIEEAFKIIVPVEEDEDEAIMEDDKNNNVINHVVNPEMSDYISRLDKAFIDRNFD